MSEEHIEQQVNKVFSEINSENPELIAAFGPEEQISFDPLDALDIRERCLYMLGTAHGMLEGMPTVISVATAIPVFNVLMKTCIKLGHVALGLAEQAPLELRPQIVEGAMESFHVIESIPASQGAEQRMGVLVWHLIVANNALIRTLAVLAAEDEEGLSERHLRRAKAALDGIPYRFKVSDDLGTVVGQLYLCEAALLNTLQSLATIDSY